MTDSKLDIETSPEKLVKSVGVKQMNKVPILIVAGILIVFMSCIVFVLVKRSGQNKPSVSDESVTQAIAPDAAVAQIISNQPEGMVPVISIPNPAQDTIDSRQLGVRYTPELQQRHNDETKKIRDMKLKLMQEALYSDTKPNSASNYTNMSPSQVPQFQMPELQNPMSGALEGLSASALNQDPNKQERKEAFLSQTKNTGYLPHTRTPALSEYEIKTGTIIPAVMISGINSDLPGQIIAQVSQHVYDTATGRHMLIPQGSKLIGYYDSQVTFGQSRVLVAWHRVIFPDASTLELESMPGSDQSGYAGFHDKVNTHFWKIFGNATLLSVVTAGFQMSQPDRSNPQSAQSQLSAAMGQQFSQLGMEMAKKNMDVQPTIEIRPGYRFNVMVNKDVMFQSPYQF